MSALELISPELAEKILDSLQKGSEGLTTTLSSVVNEFLNFMIFVEVMNVSKLLLVLFFAWLVRKAFKLFENAQEEQADKDKLRGWGILAVTAISFAGVYMTYSSFISLGKVVLAPKVYLIEMAFQKAKEIKAAVPK